MAKKSTSGRKKIPIDKIKKKSHLQVTFSKRRSGVFKKASELCTLCGVEIALLVFSPAGKVFSFGHPRVDSIFDRYLTRNPLPNSCDRKIVEAHRNANICDLNMQLTQILDQLEAAKKQGEELDAMRKASRRQFWWEGPVDELGLNELQQLKVSMEELKRSVAKQANNVLMEHTSMYSSMIPSPGTNDVGQCYDMFGGKNFNNNQIDFTNRDVYNLGL